MKRIFYSESIRAKIVYLQTRFAGFLNHRFNKYNTAKKKLSVIIFFLCFGFASLYLAVISVLVKTVHPKAIKLQKMDIPALVKPMNWPGRDYRELRTFRQFTDSLKSSGEAAKISDSIPKAGTDIIDTAR